MRALRLTGSIVTAVLLLGAAASGADDPEVLAELSRSKVYEGEAVEYTVTLNHVKNPSPPELKGFDDFDVALLAENPQNFRQTISINGRVTNIERYGMQYVYRLTPKRSGRLVVPAPSATVGGKRVEGPELALQVVAPREQDVAALELSIQPESIYPMQPFQVTLSVFVRELPKPYADYDPVGLKQRPALRIPWAIDKDLPGGLEPRRSEERWRESLRANGTPGFTINGWAQRDAFSLLDDDPFFSGRSPFGRGFPFGDDFGSIRGPRMLVFEPKPERVVRKDAGGRDVGYWRYDFTREFTPKRIGQYQFGPATLKGQLVSGKTEADARLEDVYAVAKPITLTVKDVPSEGRPDSYIGAVGQFRVEADLAPTKAKVGDPMTLTLRMTGEGTLENASPPDLAKVAGVADNFKIYEATDEGAGTARTFTYSLRPLREGIGQFPAVPVSYFDVAEEKYVTLSTKPIPIEVGKADALSGRQIVASGAASLPGKEIEVKREGIFANVTDLSAARDETIRPARWLAGLGGLAAAYAALAGETSGVAEEVRGRVHRILEACDAARYGAADNSVAHAAGETEQLLRPLTRQLKSRRRF